MYVSRLTFHTQPGKTQIVERELHKLMAMVNDAGGLRPRLFLFSRGQIRHYLGHGALDRFLPAGHFESSNLIKMLQKIFSA